MLPFASGCSVEGTSIALGLCEDETIMGRKVLLKCARRMKGCTAQGILRKTATSQTVRFAGARVIWVQQTHRRQELRSSDGPRKLPEPGKAQAELPVWAPRERQRGEGVDIEAEGGHRASSIPKPTQALAKEPHSLAHQCRSPDPGPHDSSGLWLLQAQPVTGDPDITPAREVYHPQLGKLQTSR